MKHEDQTGLCRAAQSPPHGGVWIETDSASSLSVSLNCHPLTGGCGLKHARRAGSLVLIGHPLTGGCGLKHVPGRTWGRGDAVTPSRGGVD